MFGLARLLTLAGSISWRCSRKWNWRRAERAALAVEELEDRVVPTLLGQQLFPADYPWNQNIANAPVAANSAAVISHIGSSIGLHPDWGEDSASNGNNPLYGIPYNVVHGNAAGVTKINVIIDNYPGESDIVAVPMPANPVIEGDFQNGPNNNGGGYNANQRGDSHMIVWDEDNNIAYELYGVTRPADPKLFPNTSGVELAHTYGKWHAAQESVWHMSADSFRTLADTSADAAGLSILAGLARPDEGLPTSAGGQGAIDHALRFTLPSGDVNPQYIYPASHVVSTSSSSTKLPFGARLRLMNTPAVNSVISTLQPEAQIIAHAMQQYGLVLADIGSAMYITGSSAAQDASNNISLTWNLDDVLGLHSLTAADFQVVDLTPQVTGLSATSAAAGTTITITGQNFSGSAGHLSVLFGSTPATSVTYVDDSHITAVIPNGSGTVHVQVQSGVNATDPNNPSDNVKNPIFGYGISSATGADLFTFSSQPVSGSNSTAAFAAGSVASGLTDTLTITVVDTSGAAVAGLANSAFSFGLSGGTSAGTFGAVSATSTPGTYTSTFTGTTAGTTSTLTVTINGVTLTTQPTIKVTVGAVSGAKSTASFATSTVAYAGTDVLTIVVKDAAGNAVTGLASGSFALNLSGGTSAGAFGAVSESATNGTYTATFTATASGTATTVTAVVSGVTLANKPTVTVTPPSASLPFTDNFNAGSQLSSYWQNQVGNLSIVNKNATGQAATNLATLHGINQGNVSVQADVTVAAGQFAGLVARYHGTGDTNMYFGAIVANGSGFLAKILVNINGTWTVLVSNSIGTVGNGTLLFATIGSSLRLFWQPTGTKGFVLAASAMNSALTMGSVGIRAGSGAMLTNFVAAVANPVSPQNASLTFSEDFTAANYPSGLGSQLSSYWQNQLGNLSIVNSNATGPSTINTATLNGVRQANVAVQADVNVAAGEFAGLVSRYQGTGDQNMYMGAIVSSGSGFVAKLLVNVNGTWTQLAPAMSIGSTGKGTLLFKTIGTTLQLNWNGTLIVSATDSRLSAGSVGIRTGSGAGIANFTATAS